MQPQFYEIIAFALWCCCVGINVCKRHELIMWPQSAPRCANFVKHNLHLFEAPVCDVAIIAPWCCCAGIDVCKQQAAGRGQAAGSRQGPGSRQQAAGSQKAAPTQKISNAPAHCPPSHCFRCQLTVDFVQQKQQFCICLQRQSAVFLIAFVVNFQSTSCSRSHNSTFVTDIN